MAHKTLVGGTAYDISGGRTLVGGTGYDIAKGRTLVGGTGYDIAFGIKLGDLPVGTSVYILENGTAREYLIVNQGIPSDSSLYDSSCNGTWLLRKDIYRTREWNRSESNSYKASTIHTYLNGTFLNLFDSNIKAQIKSVKIPHVNGTGYGKVASGSSGLSTNIFLLSGYEVGFTTSTSSSFPIDGALLSYFSTTSPSKRIAYLNGNRTAWWLRSPILDTSYKVWMVQTNGIYLTNVSCTDSYQRGVRPALVMSSETLVDSNLNVLA